MTQLTPATEQHETVWFQLLTLSIHCIRYQQYSLPKVSILHNAHLLNLHLHDSWSYRFPSNPWWGILPMASWVDGIHFHKIRKLTPPPCASTTIPTPPIPFLNIAFNPKVSLFPLHPRVKAFSQRLHRMVKLVWIKLGFGPLFPFPNISVLSTVFMVLRTFSEQWKAGGLARDWL